MWWRRRSLFINWFCHKFPSICWSRVPKSGRTSVCLTTDVLLRRLTPQCLPLSGDVISAIFSEPGLVPLLTLYPPAFVKQSVTFGERFDLFLPAYQKLGKCLVISDETGVLSYPIKVTFFRGFIRRDSGCFRTDIRLLRQSRTDASWKCTTNGILCVCVSAFVALHLRKVGQC